MSVLLEVNGISVSFDGFKAINNLSFSISNRELRAIIGPNGAGKSTLANVIMGHPAYEITSGSVKFKGTPLEEMEVFERARNGYGKESQTTRGCRENYNGLESMTAR